jgi:hypothetical protein
MDALQQLASDAQYAAAILLNGSDIELIDLDRPETAKTISAARGLAFVGVIAMLKGQPRMTLEQPLDGETARAVIQAFTHHVRRCTRCWAAPVDRHEN